MGKKKNNHEKKAKHAALLDSFTGKQNPAGSLKDTGVATVRDLVIGVIGGGVAGAALGRSSLIVGAVITGGGHYYNSQLATMFGVGMMAANGFQSTDKSVKGIEPDFLNGLKDRMTAYKATFQEKFFLDKLLKAKKAVNGLEGKVQYFTYPLAKELERSNVKELDMAALNRIEQQIVNSANSFAQQPEVNGLLGMGFTEVGEMNF